jgi:hypothetical protein
MSNWHGSGTARKTKKALQTLPWHGGTAKSLWAGILPTEKKVLAVSMLAEDHPSASWPKLTRSSKSTAAGP